MSLRSRIFKTDHLDYYGDMGEYRGEEEFVHSCAPALRCQSVLMMSGAFVCPKERSASFCFFPSRGRLDLGASRIAIPAVTFDLVDPIAGKNAIFGMPMLGEVTRSFWPSVM